MRRGLYAATLLATASLLARDARAQWAPEVQLVPNVDTALLVSSGDSLHLVYSTGMQVLYRQSMDQGTTWGTDVPVATGKIHYTDPIAVDGSDVYVAYLGDIRTATTFYGSDEVGNLYFAHSGDSGATWDAPCQLTTTDDVFRLSMDTSGTRVDIAWSNYSNPNGGQIYYRTSPNRGACASWSAVVDLDPSSTSATRPQVADWGNTVHIVWEVADSMRPACFTEPSCPDNYYVRSTNGGASFEPVQHITSYPAAAPIIGRPEITLLPPSGTVVFFHQDLTSTSPTHQVFFSQVSTANGAAGSWSSPLQVTDVPGTNNHPAAGAAAGSIALIAWTDVGVAADGGTGPTTPRFSMSSPGAQTWIPSEQVSTQDGLYANDVAATSKWAHVVYNGFSGGPLYYRRRALPLVAPDAGADAAIDSGSSSGGVPDASGPDSSVDSSAPVVEAGGGPGADGGGSGATGGSSGGCGCASVGSVPAAPSSLVSALLVVATLAPRRRR